MKIFNGNTTYVQIKDLMFIKSIYKDEEIPPQLLEVFNDLTQEIDGNLFVKIDDIRPFMLKQFYILDFNLYHALGEYEAKMQLDGLEHVLTMYEEKLRHAESLQEVRNIKQELLKNNYMENTLYEMYVLLYNKGPYNVPITERVNGESFEGSIIKVSETTNPSAFLFTRLDGKSFTYNDFKRSVVLNYINKLNISATTHDNFENYCFDIDIKDDKALVKFNQKRYGLGNEFLKQKKRVK